MAIVGFGFSKMLAEKKDASEKQIKIKNDVSIKNISSSDMSVGSAKEKILKFSFEFSSDYSSLGKISLKGEVAYSGSEKKHKEIIDQWKESKVLKDDIAKPVISYILRRCNIQSLILSKDVNLPPPIPLPKLKP